MNKKICACCKELKNISEFNSNCRQSDGLQDKCKICFEIWRKKRIDNNKAKSIEYLGGKCVKCGYSKCNAALDFHHLNPKEKENGKMQMTCWGWKRLKKELDKCILLCANCHREVHNS